MKKDIKVIRILFYDDQQSFTALRKFQDLRNLISEKTYVDLTLKNVKLHLVEYSNEKGVGILNIPYRAYGEIELLTRSEE